LHLLKISVKPQSNPYTLTLNCIKEVKSTQKQPNCKKNGAALKGLGKKVGKSKVAAKKWMQ